jgi:hypothetical protein
MYTLAGNFRAAVTAEWNRPRPASRIPSEATWDRILRDSRRVLSIILHPTNTFDERAEHNGVLQRVWITMAATYLSHRETSAGAPDVAPEANLRWQDTALALLPRDVRPLATPRVHDPRGAFYPPFNPPPATTHTGGGPPSLVPSAAADQVLNEQGEVEADYSEDTSNTPTETTDAQYLAESNDHVLIY